jgi:hypothetical protein
MFSRWNLNDGFVVKFGVAISTIIDIASTGYANTRLAIIRNPSIDIVRHYVVFAGRRLPDRI